MKTLTILNTGEIVLGIKTWPGEFYGDVYIKVHTQSRPDKTRIYFVRKNPPETQDGILYNAGFMKTRDGVTFIVRPQGVYEEKLFLVLLKRDEFSDLEGYVNVIYGEDEDLAYRLLVAEEGSEFEICDPEENWVTVKITEPKKSPT